MDHLLLISHNNDVPCFDSTLLRAMVADGRLLHSMATQQCEQEGLSTEIVTLQNHKGKGTRKSGGGFIFTPQISYLTAL